VGYNIHKFTVTPVFQLYIAVCKWGESSQKYKKFIYTNMEKLNLQNVSRETLEKKYFELLDIQAELKDYQIEIENVLFLPF